MAIIIVTVLRTNLCYIVSIKSINQHAYFLNILYTRLSKFEVLVVASSNHVLSYRVPLMPSAEEVQTYQGVVSTQDLELHCIKHNPQGISKMCVSITLEVCAHHGLASIDQTNDLISLEHLIDIMVFIIASGSRYRDILSNHNQYQGFLRSPISPVRVGVSVISQTVLHLDVVKDGCC